jgi:hypothetical protein
MTVAQLISKINQNCPPGCQDKVVVSDDICGTVGPLVNVRYRHESGKMILDLVYGGDEK